MLKDNLEVKMLHPIIGLFLLFLNLGCEPSKNIKPNPNLPPPEFEIEHSRSDLNRSLREYKKRYNGPIFDAHAHLDPPESGIIRKILGSLRLEATELIAYKNAERIFK